MKYNFKSIINILLIIILPFVFILGCENEYPDSIYDPDAPIGETPEITSVSPPDSTLAGVGEITITGKNFSADKSRNAVFFNAKVAEINESSETQIIVKTPNLLSDSIGIRVAVQEAELFSNIMQYKLKPAAVAFGNLMEGSYVYGIAIDQQGNLFLSLEGNEIQKIAPDGSTGLFCATSFLKADNMKMGPNNTIFATFTGRIRKLVAIDANGVETTYASLPANPKDFDFDENGDIWVSIGNDVYIVKAEDQTNQKMLTFDNETYTIRVFEGHVYILTKGTDGADSKIYRAEILDETLGEPELVLDISAATWLNNSNVLCFTFSAAGTMVLGTEAEPDAIFLYNLSDGSNEVLYPGLVAPNIYAMSWDESSYLYVVRQYELDDGTRAVEIIRIDMAQDGAPYYGRR
ncbi:IPT/TIG domain-containing protein [candidate division KSB1 bacterium]|nr:IPT/TIG domain-containing protein [candidate division KSB1 bacterium]